MTLSHEGVSIMAIITVALGLAFLTGLVPIALLCDAPKRAPKAPRVTLPSGRTSAIARPSEGFRSMVARDFARAIANARPTPTAIDYAPSHGAFCDALPPRVVRGSDRAWASAEYDAVYAAVDATPARHGALATRQTRVVRVVARGMADVFQGGAS